MQMKLGNWAPSAWLGSELCVNTVNGDTNSWHMIAAWSVSGEIAHTQDQVSVKHDERRAWKAEEESELTFATMSE